MKIHLGLGRQWLCVSLGECAHMWQGGVWMCFRWEEREKSQLKMESSGKQSEEVVARAGNVSAEGPWELSQWEYRSTEEHRWVGLGGRVGHCWVSAWTPLTGLMSWMPCAKEGRPWLQRGRSHVGQG